MTTKLRHALLALPALMMTTGCDLHLLPETYEGQGDRAAIVTVELGSLNTNLLEAGVDTLEIQIIDVLAHREGSDEWLILNEAPTALTISDDEEVSVELSEVPLPVGTYDRILLVLAEARADGNGGWTKIEITTDDIEIAEPVTIVGDGMLTLDFDVANSLTGTYNDGLVMDPQVLVQAQ